MTLWDNIYQAPEEPMLRDLVAFAIFFVVLVVLDARSRAPEDVRILYWATAVGGIMAGVLANSSQFTRWDKQVLAAAYAILILGFILVIVSVAGQRSILGKYRLRDANIAGGGE